jgi:hypothetical protein
MRCVASIGMRLGSGPGSPAPEDSVEDAKPRSATEAVVERPGSTVADRRVHPVQPVAQDRDDAAPRTTIAGPRRLRRRANRRGPRQAALLQAMPIRRQTLRLEDDLIRLEAAPTGLGPRN